jgi:uncharacterized protein with gpF-like domain
MIQFAQANHDPIIHLSARGRQETIAILEDQVAFIHALIISHLKQMHTNHEHWMQVAREGFNAHMVISTVIDHTCAERIAQLIGTCRMAAKVRVRKQAQAHGVQFAEKEFPRELTPDKAIEWIKSLPIATREHWEMILAQSHQAAFFITGIEQRETLNVIQKAIEDSLKQGWTLKQYEAEVRAQLDDLALTGGRLRNVWHNVVTSSYQQERYKELADPEVKAVLPYFMFDALIDGVTRENHALLDNGIAPQDWFGWMTYKPMLGFNCRCQVIALTAGRAESLLASGECWDMTQGVPPGAGPDEGYRRMVN